MSGVNDGPKSKSVTLSIACVPRAVSCYKQTILMHRTILQPPEGPQAASSASYSILGELKVPVLISYLFCTVWDCWRVFMSPCFQSLQSSFRNVLHLLH